MSKYLMKSYSVQGLPAPGRINQDEMFKDPKKLVAIVADGISSAPAGKQAAFEAVNWARLQLSFLKGNLAGGKLSPSEVEEKIRSAVQFTNRVIRNIPANIPAYKGWGTTLDCCLIFQDVAYFGHVGDSKIFYMGSSGTLEQLTTDQVVPVYSNLDALSGVERKLAAMQSHLANYVGKKKMYVDTFSRKLEIGDVLFLATDGVTKSISEDSLASVLMDFDSSNNVKLELVKLLHQPSEYASAYARLKGMTVEDAQQQLWDDATFIAIKRVT